MKTSSSHKKYPDSVIVIPAYQPSENLITLVHTLSLYGYSAIVVDDGSDSNCSHIWEQLKDFSIIIHHPQNLGKGAALKTAFQFINNTVPEANYIITMDADGQHLPQDMEQVASYARKHAGTLVLGSRSFETNTPLRSKLGNKLTRFVFSLIAKTNIQDTQTGLRAFDRSLLDYMLNIPGSRYEYEMNVLLRCREHHIPIAEVPIQTVYLDKKNSSSHFDTIQDSVQIYKNILKFTSSSLVSFLADYILFLLLTMLFPAETIFLIMSNVLARLGSAALNFTLNTKAVFHDSHPLNQTLSQYATLALSVLAANSLLLTIFVNMMGVPTTFAKLITEMILFILSYTVQSKVIFRPDRRKKGGTHH